MEGLREPSPADGAPALKARLAEACRRAGIAPTEPIAPIMTGLGEVADAVASVPGEIRNALKEARQPIDQAAIVDRLGKEAARVMNAHAQQFLYQAWRRMLVIAAGLLVGVAAVCLGGGYWWGSASARGRVQETEAELRAAFATGPDAAQVWLSLMQWNDPRKALAQCQGQNASAQSGRRACNVPLWIEAPRSGG